MPAAPLPSLALVGPGRAGRAFARSWLAAGGALAAVVARDPDAARGAAAALGAGVPFAADELPPRLEGDVLVLAVPDDALSASARSVAGRSAALFAFHLSGALPADEIGALRESGRAVGSLHPLRAFSGAPDETLRGARVAVEGDPRACDAALEYVAALGARGQRIDRSAKTLYHAGATLAAGGAVALLSLAARAWALAGISEEDARPPLAELAVNATGAARRRSFEESLTGPVARRDVRTVRAHCDALAASPDLLRVYVALAHETLARTPGRGREDEIRAALAPAVLHS